MPILIILINTDTETREKVGIIAWKRFSDTVDVLDLLGIDKKSSKDLGIHLLKMGMSWPLDIKRIENFSSDLDEVIIVEEKRSFLEIMSEVTYLIIKISQKE